MAHMSHTVNDGTYETDCPSCMSQTLVHMDQSSRTSHMDESNRTSHMDESYCTLE